MVTWETSISARCLNIGTNCHAVGGDAEQGFRMIFPDGPHGGDGFRAIGKGIAGAGDAGHADPRLFFQNLLHIDSGLFRGENGAGDARSRLVDAVIFTVAEVAFDIAFWGDRQMYSAEFAFGVGIESRDGCGNLCFLSFS